MSERVNYFDELRLVGALLVAVSHSFAVVGGAQPEINGRSLGMIGLFIFFGISGYLVSQSFERDPAIWRFLARRALRIFPALAVVLIGTVFVIGPALSTAPDFLARPATWLYFIGNMMLVFMGALPGLFADNPIKGANNSLWTLHIEFILYTVTPLICVIVARKVGAWSLLIVGAIFACTITPEATGWFIWHRALTLVGCFLMGAALNRLRLERMGLTAVFAVALSLAVPVLLPAAVILASLAIGEMLIPSRFSVRRVGDLSYGMYLWAFPVQQSVVMLLGGAALFNLVVTLIAIVPIAYISWRLVERPALRLKPRASPLKLDVADAPLAEAAA